MTLRRAFLQQFFYLPGGQEFLSRSNRPMPMNFSERRSRDFCSLNAKPRFCMSGHTFAHHVTSSYSRKAQPLFSTNLGVQMAVAPRWLWLVGGGRVVSRSDRALLARLELGV